MSSSDDETTLRNLAHDTIQSFVAVTVETFSIAVYSVLVFKTGALLLRKKRTRVVICTFFALFVLYALALSLWMIDIHNVIAEVQNTLLSNSENPLQERYSSAVSEVLRLASVQDFLYAYMTVIGDGIVIWRVYAFWGTGRWRFVFLIPIAFLLGSIATSIILTYCAARLGSDIVLGAYQHPAFCHNIQTASYSTTLVTTGVATLLISYKTWEYRQTYLNAFGKSPRTRTQKIMLILIESGILYVLFFLSPLITNIDSLDERIKENAILSFASTIYQYNVSPVVGIYPTIIILIVNSKRSVLQETISTLRSKSTHTTNRSNYLNTTSSATATVPAGHAPTTIDLYEMARLESTDGEEPEIEDRNKLVVKVQQQSFVTSEV